MQQRLELSARLLPAPTLPGKSADTQPPMRAVPAPTALLNLLRAGGIFHFSVFQISHKRARVVHANLELQREGNPEKM